MVKRVKERLILRGKVNICGWLGLLWFEFFNPAVKPVVLNPQPYIAVRCRFQYRPRTSV